MEQFGPVQNAAAAAGITIPRWYRIERGLHPGQVGSLLDPLARLFGVTADQLIADPEAPRRLRTVTLRHGGSVRIGQNVVTILSANRGQIKVQIVTPGDVRVVERL
jgi:hypothetical protein